MTASSTCRKQAIALKVAVVGSLGGIDFHHTRRLAPLPSALIFAIADKRSAVNVIESTRKSDHKCLLTTVILFASIPRPCGPSAVFDCVRADGSGELRKFAKSLHADNQELYNRACELMNVGLQKSVVLSVLGITPGSWYTMQRRHDVTKALDAENIQARREGRICRPLSFFVRWKRRGIVAFSEAQVRELIERELSGNPSCREIARPIPASAVTPDKWRKVHEGQHISKHMFNAKCPLCLEAVSPPIRNDLSKDSPRARRQPRSDFVGSKRAFWN
jgi:hypothetical protein